LAGYVTLFHFCSPFRKPIPGTIVRICQALILPPYQRAGHGRQMLATIHRWVRGEYVAAAAAAAATTTTKTPTLLPTSLACADADSATIVAADHFADIVEINVEDPAPAFVALRNRVDFEEFLRAKKKGEPWIVAVDDNDDKSRRTTCSSSNGGGGGRNDDAAKSLAAAAAADSNVHDEAFFQPLTEARARSAATRAKITSRQIHIVYELDRLYYVFQLTKKHGVVFEQQQAKNDDSSSNSNRSDHDNKNILDNEHLEKQFRLMVKRRLKREHKEDLSNCKGGKAEMQALLAKLYDDQRSMYEAILSSMLK
jgi:histone acetyltransferase 1